MDRNIINKVIIGFLIYSLVLMFIGKQLPFIPQIKLGGKMQHVESSDLRQNVLEKFLKGEKGGYSIYYKNLKTGETFGVDENKMQTAASLNKLPIVAYLYNQASDGKINLEDKISIQKDDIQDYGTGSIRYGGEGQVYSLKTLTKLALEQSDNTAAHVLSLRLGTENIQKYARSLGLISTNMVNNKTTAADMGRLLAAIYERKVANEALTRELLDFMKDTDFEDRLVRFLPKNVSTHHKAADGVAFVHDVGIIDNGKSPFVLSVLTSEVSNQGKAKEVISKIAEFIYERGN
jgi:beta-lactamase class A